MSYGDYDLKSAVQTFGLTEQGNSNLFADVAPLEPSETLRDWLEEFAPVALGFGSEMARSTFIVAPILAETKRRSETAVNIAPGVNFDVDKTKGLTGYCDYLLVRSAEIYYVRGPILAVVEAKKEDLVGGLGQCVAAMVAIQIFNQREGSPTPVVFGCVTSGNLWRFLKLDGTNLFIDQPEYYLSDVAKIVGILVSIVRQ